MIVKGHRKLAVAYAAYVMAVYSHYRYRSYIRETLAQGKIPWSYLDDDNVWLKQELKSKALEIGYWTYGESDLAPASLDNMPAAGQSW